MRNLSLSISVVALIVLAIMGCFFISASWATEEYAEITHQECGACHVDPLGGGDLTEMGKGYFLSLSPSLAENQVSQSGVQRGIRLLALYIHILTAFMWFGTILYVHIVLKPAYAAKGLPPGEVKVGLVSMLLMALSGAVLTYYKIPSLDLLVSSRFGILLLIKISLFALMVLSALFVVLVIGPKLKGKKIAQPSASGELTAEALSAFNGENGKPFYFAYKGVIYDASSSKLWRNGAHMRRHQAGMDLTDVLSQAPHGEDKILAMPVIGKLAAATNVTSPDLHKKVFYFMAYMNLSFVFIIIFILALWRW